MTTRIAARLTALERLVAPPENPLSVRVIVISSTDDPAPRDGSLDRWLSAHPPCCAGGQLRMVQWRDGNWCEEQPRCFVCREESAG